jgi:hypothetical protein
VARDPKETLVADKYPNHQRLGTFKETLVGGERVRAFIPPPLPPPPMLQMDGMNVLLEQANQALGRLDG